MEDDPKVLLMGEDIGKLGGVFRVTDGLQKDFGEDRVIDTPLAESGIIGTAIGLALRGYRPVCEIQFDGFVFPGLRPDRRPAGQDALPLPASVDAADGGPDPVRRRHRRRRAPQREPGGVLRAHGWPARWSPAPIAVDAYWMIQQAIATDDPVIFFEPKRRYWEKADVDEDAAPRTWHWTRPGSCAGTDATLVAYGPMVKTALDAAAAAAEEGRSLEVIDLRSLSPLDLPVVFDSVRKTGRCVVVHEAPAASGSVPRSRRGSPRSASTRSRRRCCASPGSTRPTRRRGSRRSTFPTSTAYSTPSTAPSRTR